jgi:serine/threonine protein kinase
MSPEQITETKSVTAQSDIYSLGVVLWQMVTGQKPYDTKTLSNFQLQSKIVNELLLLTKTTWDAVIRKATAKEVQARYSSASEFSKALHPDNIATDNQDATVVGGGKDETVVQKDHDKTVVDDAPKKEKDISLKERFAIASRNESSKQTDLAPTKNSSVATNIQVSISFEGVFTLIDHKVNVYADDIKVGTGSLRNGFHLNFIVYRSQPILVVSILFKRKKIAIPKLEIGKKYEITIDFDRYIKGNFNSKPKEIRVLSIPSVE